MNKKKSGTGKLTLIRIARGAFIPGRSRLPRHKSNFTHCQVSSLTLIRIARGARFGVIEVI